MSSQSMNTSILPIKLQRTILIAEFTELDVFFKKKTQNKLLFWRFCFPHENKRFAEYVEFLRSPSFTSCGSETWCKNPIEFMSFGACKLNFPGMHVYLCLYMCCICVYLQYRWLCDVSQQTLRLLRMFVFLCWLYVHVSLFNCTCPPSRTVPGDGGERVPWEGPAGCVPHQGQQRSRGVPAGHGACQWEPHRGAGWHPS